jgi:hypothetical protein
MTTLKQNTSLPAIKDVAIRNNESGSEWSIWDLHVHSPVWSSDQHYEQFIENLAASEATVIGINDYCTVEGYKQIMKRGGVPGKVLFPVVELRMNNIVGHKKGAAVMGSGARINFHLIFNNDPTVFDRIEIFVKSLTYPGPTGERVPLGAISADEVHKAAFNFMEVLAEVNKMGLHDHCIVWTPYNEYGGIDPIDPNDGYFKLHIIKYSDIIGSGQQKQIEFFKWSDPKFTAEQYRQFTGVPKPCIKGSDSHDIDYPFGRLRDEKSEPIERYCWIKGNPTFSGLHQILYEPDRVYIGKEPQLLERRRSFPHKFISALSIDKAGGVRPTDTWFQETTIPFNAGLVAIIGKKGNGKSAIADILGLCANSKNDPEDLSFLHRHKFKNPKANRAKEHVAKLMWADGGDSGNINLDSVASPLNEERVKYIPQNYLEKLCVNEEQKEFEAELKQIIYAHIPEIERLGQRSLDELLMVRQKAIEGGIRKLQVELSAINKIITHLENKNKPSYRNSIEQQIADREAELKHHVDNKPQERPKPDEDETQRELNRAVVAALTEATSARTALERQVQTLTSELRQNNIAINELELARKELGQLDKTINSVLQSNRTTLEKHGIKLDDVFTYRINLIKVSEKLAEYHRRNNEINVAITGQDDQLGLQQQIAAINLQTQGLQNQLAQSQKEYHEYLQSLEAWEKRRKEIVGSSDDANSLEFFKWELAYLNVGLRSELDKQYLERVKITGEIFKGKLELLSLYSSLYRPVTEVLQKEATFVDDYNIHVNASFTVRGFADRFLSFINQRSKGTYAGVQEGRDAIEQLLATQDISNADGLNGFMDAILASLTHDQRGGYQSEPRYPDEQLKGEQKLEDLYDYIFGLSYIEPQFKLQLGTKDLRELSPGERGAILLIFYLFLDLDNKPLIIDQPEENLDNESIYHYLVHFIKKAKSKRQIILITHNPNLAVVCDADQIIHMSIDKQHGNKVAFVSGAIENQMIAKLVINILEGTKPAFDNRRLKYASIID